MYTKGEIYGNFSAIYGGTGVFAAKRTPMVYVDKGKKRDSEVS